MNSRERVMRALRRDGLPDRVPLQFDLCRPLLEAFGAKLRHPGRLHAHPTTRTSSTAPRATSSGSRWAATACVVGGGLPAGYEPEQTDDGCIVNEFGMKMKPGLAWYDVVERPAGERPPRVEEVRDLPFPDPLDEGRFDDAEATSTAIGASTSSSATSS